MIYGHLKWIHSTQVQPRFYQPGLNLLYVGVCDSVISSTKKIHISLLPVALQLHLLLPSNIFGTHSEPVRTPPNTTLMLGYRQKWC